MQAKTPMVSVIIPTYNRENLLPRAIKSVLTQTFQDFEIIIVDDGSGDNTGKVVEKFHSSDKRIEYFRKEISEGVARAKNIGIKNARGKFIAFLDSDDEWLPEKLEAQLAIFGKASKKNFGLVSCDAFIVSGDKKIIYSVSAQAKRNILKSFLLGNFIWSCSSVIVKKEVLDKIGFFDESIKYGEDWDMWIRISEHYDFGFAGRPLFNYHLHGNNISFTTGDREKIESDEKVFEKHSTLREKYFPGLHNDQLRVMGIKYFLIGEKKNSHYFFKKSIRVNPFNYKNYIYYFLSLLGKSPFKKFCYRRNKLVEAVKDL